MSIPAESAILAPSRGARESRWRGRRHGAIAPSSANSHKDRAAGNRLFNRLDGYRPPKALRGRETPFGPPSKLYPVFRDREELASSPALAGRLEAALDASSDHLVVICSPHAAASRWVNEEIRIFQRTGRGNRIHAALVDGEPPAAFPPALTDSEGSEPLATDLRKRG